MAFGPDQELKRREAARRRQLTPQDQAQRQKTRDFSATMARQSGAGAQTVPIPNASPGDATKPQAFAPALGPPRPDDSAQRSRIVEMDQMDAARAREGMPPMDRSASAPAPASVGPPVDRSDIGFGQGNIGSVTKEQILAKQRLAELRRQQRVNAQQIGPDRDRDEQARLATEARATRHRAQDLGRLTRDMAPVQDDATLEANREHLRQQLLNQLMVDRRRAEIEQERIGGMSGDDALAEGGRQFFPNASPADQAALGAAASERGLIDIGDLPSVQRQPQVESELADIDARIAEAERGGLIQFSTPEERIRHREQVRAAMERSRQEAATRLGESNVQEEARRAEAERERQFQEITQRAAIEEARAREAQAQQVTREAGGGEQGRTTEDAIEAAERSTASMAAAGLTENIRSGADTAATNLRVGGMLTAIQDGRFNPGRTVTDELQNIKELENYAQKIREIGSFDPATQRMLASEVLVNLPNPDESGMFEFDPTFGNYRLLPMILRQFTPTTRGELEVAARRLGRLVQTYRDMAGQNAQ